MGLLTEKLNDNNELLDKAIDLIRNFLKEEYGDDDDSFLGDLKNVDLAYTTFDNDYGDEVEVQVSVDLKKYEMKYYIDGKLSSVDTYKSLENLIEYELNNLDYDELVYRCYDDLEKRGFFD